MAGEVVAIMAEVVAAMRLAFDNRENPPLGGVTGRIKHTGGLLVPLDGFPTSGEGNDQCDASMAFTNVLRRWKTTQFPGESSEVTPCGGVRAVLVQMGVARCSMAMDDEGNAPDDDRVEHEALVLLDDSDRLYAAACRATKMLEEAELIDAAVIHAWEPVGPDGGILSGLLTVSFQIA